VAGAAGVARVVHRGHGEADLRVTVLAQIALDELAGALGQPELERRATAADGDVRRSRLEARVQARRGEEARGIDERSPAA
jgi:hypothetical protein